MISIWLGPTLVVLYIIVVLCYIGVLWKRLDVERDTDGSSFMCCIGASITWIIWLIPFVSYHIYKKYWEK